ncbi:CoA-transferase [Flavonifractor sp. AGMB03687]|uniref:CoA-transferase n=1 Tax=Flavonifractor sp. AGMB03687 TaxID=2785133 RepID=UPI001ADFF6C6|nr:CoA-transferase [Flavonifractor sp. AGMB03687]
MNNRNFIAKRAAAYFKPGDVVNLGIGIPSLCGSYAAQGVLFQSENGFIGIGATVNEGLMANERFVNAGGVHFEPVPGSSAFDVAMSFGVIRSGRLAATVLGGLQVSAQGDLANWATPGRAFGMGGAMDLCNGAKQVIVAMDLVAKDGSPKIVNQCTLPLTAVRCVNHIVTDRCVIDVTPEGLLLSEIRKGHTVEEIQAAVEPKLLVASNLIEMEED